MGILLNTIYSYRGHVMCQMPSWMTSGSYFVQGLLKKGSKGTIYTLGSLPPWTLQTDNQFECGLEYEATCSL